MIVRVRRNPVLKRRIKQIHRELTDVDESLESLADGVETSAVPPDSLNAAGPIIEADPIAGSPSSVSRVEAVTHARAKRVRDERFSEYLSSSFQPSRPLKRERNIQRNKAIVMLGVLVLVVYWFIVRFWS